MAKRQLLLPFVSVKKQRRLEKGDALKSLLNSTLVDNADSVSAPADEHGIVCLHGLDVASPLEHSTIECGWDDGSFTLQFVGDLLNNSALLRRCVPAIAVVSEFV